MKSNLSPLGIQPTDLADPRKLVRKILEIARKRFRVERAALYLYNPNLGDLEIDMALGVSRSYNDNNRLHSFYFIVFSNHLSHSGKLLCWISISKL